MAHQLPQPQFSTPRIEQRIDFESGQFQPSLFNLNFPPEAGPALAPGDVSTIRYGEIPSDGYSSSPGGGFQFTSLSASGPVPPVGLPLESYPQSYSQRCQPSIWSPTPHDGQFPNIPSPSAHRPLAPAQAAPLGQFQGSHDLMTTFGPTALHPAQVLGVASDIAPEPPQQPRAQVVSQSTPRHPRFRIRIRQKFPSLKISTPRDCNACWKCRNDHKFCSPGTPCDECVKKPPSNSAISCHRGPVCDVTAEIPFLCHVPRGARKLPPSLPAPFQHVANHLSQLKQWRLQRQMLYRHKLPHNEAECNHCVFCTIINTKVEDIRYNETQKRMKKVGLITSVVLSLPYDDLIADLVWELEDNPNVVELTGVGTVEDFVALLEAACLCEAEDGVNDETKRLVYNSIRCLLYGLEALQLAADGMLITDSHSHCVEAGQCISPALHGLTRYSLRFTEALTMALFHKHRAKHQNWLLVFYSLCIQSHVRRVFMSLEQHQRSSQSGLTAGDMEVDGYVRPLRSAKYLHTAVSLFGEISTQSRCKLAKMILDSRPKPSVYLQKLASHPSRAAGIGGTSGSTWQKWRTEGVPEFLRKAFQLTPDGRPGSGTDSDSDTTIRIATAPLLPAVSTETVVGAATAAAATPISTTLQVHGAISNADGECWMDFSPTSSREPSIASMWSETSYGDSLDLSTFYAGSLASSSPSYAESLVSSTGSVATMTPNEGGDIFLPLF